MRKEDLRRASVVLVDYRIDDWPERDKLKPVTLRPADGLAIVAVVRSFANKEIPRRPRAYAIHSALLDELSAGLPVQSGEHAIARTANLEWVFAKNELGSSVSFFDQVSILADGVARLPARWPAGARRATEKAHQLLGLPARASWKERAKAEIQACRLPAHAFASATNGMAFVRWLLHGILPYPCFLWDIRYLAARLRVSPVDLRVALNSETKCARSLRLASYNGAFSGFTGPRWWRAAIEDLIWKWTRGNPFDTVSVAQAVKKHLSPSLEPVDVLQPVVTVDSQYRPSDILLDIGLAVEVQPDGWPAYADKAWVAREDASASDDFRAIVVRGDLSLLD